MSLTPIFDQLRCERAARPRTAVTARDGAVDESELTETRLPPSLTAGGPALDADAAYAVTLAQREAHALGHTYYGTEHLLLALVCSGHPVGQLLVDAGADLPTLRRAATAYHPHRPHDAEGAAEPESSRTAPRWTVTAASVFASARRHAGVDRAHRVKPGHLLSALLEPGHGLTPGLLLAAGVDPDTVTARNGLRGADRDQPSPVTDGLAVSPEPESPRPPATRSPHEAGTPSPSPLPSPAGEVWKPANTR